MRPSGACAKKPFTAVIAFYRLGWTLAHKDGAYPGYSVLMVGSNRSKVVFIYFNSCLNCVSKAGAYLSGVLNWTPDYGYALTAIRYVSKAGAYPSEAGLLSKGWLLLQ